MSTTVRGHGYVARLKNKLNKEQVEELSDLLWESKSNLKINYEGTLVYYDFLRDKPLSIREDIYVRNVGKPESLDREEDLKVAAAKQNLELLDGILPFFCIWYTGSDAPMDLMELKEFEEILDAAA